MKASELPVGTVITVGHPANDVLAVKWREQEGEGYGAAAEAFRYLHDGAVLGAEDLRGGWNVKHVDPPAAEPEPVRHLMGWEATNRPGGNNRYRWTCSCDRASSEKFGSGVDMLIDWERHREDALAHR